MPGSAIPERIRVLAKLFTEEIIHAATARVVLGTPLPSTMDRGEKKLALLLVRELNADEIFSEAEECIHRGCSDKTLRGMKQRRELPAIMGGVNTVSSDS